MAFASSILCQANYAARCCHLLPPTDARAASQKVRADTSAPDWLRYEIYHVLRRAYRSRMQRVTAPTTDVHSEASVNFVSYKESHAFCYDWCRDGECPN